MPQSGRLAPVFDALLARAEWHVTVAEAEDGAEAKEIATARTPQAPRTIPGVTMSRLELGGRGPSGAADTSPSPVERWITREA